MRAESVPPILIVDDEPTLRRLMKRTLNAAGLSVVEAANGAEALALCREQEFGAVISDIRMPVMDGLDLMSHLQEMAPELPVILVSGSDEVGSPRAARALGAFDFLPKPFDLSTLSQRALSAVGANSDERASERRAVA